MKTLEQTKWAISVGLATTALLIMVAAATLFCGVTSARAQEPDNRIDWRWGRPGVMVVTNAPTAVTVTNIATDVAGGVANTKFGPRVTALEDVLDRNTNNWNAAFSWGDWSTAGLATTQQLAAIPRDRIITQDGSQWIDATGGVWRVSTGGGGYWTISILGTLYGSATNAYYEVRSAPFDFWNYDQAYWDGDAYFRWYPDGAPGHGKVYVETQGDEGSHDYNYPTNDIADGVFEFYMSSTYTHFVLAWSNDLASVSTQRVDGLAWQSDLPLYATTQQLATALAPLAAHTNRTDNPHSVTAQQIGAITVELDPVANAALVVHTNRTDNPHSVTAQQIGALTNETDEAALAALAAYAAYWPPDSTPSQYFSFTTNNNAITITGYDEDGGADVRIPSYINGWPVKAIGDGAFQGSGIESVHGDVVAIGEGAFFDCTSLTTAPFPQATTIGERAFDSCYALTTAYFPQATTIGVQAFFECFALTTATFPQATTIGYGAFYSCFVLTTAYFPQATTMGDDAFYYCTSLVDITLGTDATNFNVTAFNDINANPTITISNPHAKGWGETFAGLAVVRPEITADAFTLNGVTITEWPEGGGETSIIVPLYDSGTNITVTSTQSVYSVAVTGAGPVGIDWSGLALDGTGRAEVTLRLNVTEWGGTNATFSPSLTFDRTPEILVTGVWEFAASTIDGVTTRVRQTWPLTDEWAGASYAYASGGWVSSLQRMDVKEMSTNSLMCVCPPAPLLLIRPGIYINANKPTSFSYGFSTRLIPATSIPTTLYGPFSVGHGYRVDAIHAVENPSEYGLVQIWVGNSSPESVADVMVYPARTSIRPANANERAAYEAGWRP